MCVCWVKRRMQLVIIAELWSMGKVWWFDVHGSWHCITLWGKIYMHIHINIYCVIYTYLLCNILYILIFSITIQNCHFSGQKWLNISNYIWLYYVCMCVLGWTREREKEDEKDRYRDRDRVTESEGCLCLCVYLMVKLISHVHLYLSKIVL